MTGQQRETLARAIGVLEMAGAMLEPDMAGYIVSNVVEQLYEMLDNDEPVG